MIWLHTAGYSGWPPYQRQYGQIVAEQTINTSSRLTLMSGCRVNVLGLSFKENCPDLQNSKIADLISELKSYGIDILYP